MSQLDSGPKSSGMMTTSSCLSGLLNLVSELDPTITRMAGRTNVEAGSKDSVLRPLPFRWAVLVIRLVGSEPRGSSLSGARFGSGWVALIL